MIFNRDKFNENVDYCEFIFNKCVKYLLNLSSSDIQDIANNYVFELYNRGIDTDNEVVEDEELLLNIIDELYNSKSNFDATEELDEDMEKYLYNYKLSLERKVNANGGYGYNELYDDVSIEDINNEFSLKYIKKNK